MKNKLTNLIAERTKKLEKIWSEYDAVEEEYNKKNCRHITIQR